MSRIIRLVIKPLQVMIPVTIFSSSFFIFGFHVFLRQK